MNNRIEADRKASNLKVVLLDFSFFAYSIQLSNALSEHCNITLLQPTKIPDYYIQMVKEGVTLRQFYMPRLRYLTNIGMVRKIFAIISEVKPQLVHLLAWHPWMNLSLPFLPCKPLVVTIHDAHRHPGDRPIPFHSWQWRFADQIIVHAETIKQQMMDDHGEDKAKIHVIPHGTFDNYLAWKHEDVSEQESTILFFGRIREYKGLRYLIEAEPIITNQVPGVKIIIAGEGDPFEKYERMMINKDRYIVYNQFIPDELVARLFTEASIVVLPYTEASQSGILSIAFAFGKPVVATTVGGIPEVVTHNETGLLVPPCDHKSLAQAVITLLKDPAKRKEMGDKAKHISQSTLSWSRIAAQTYHVYQHALAGKFSIKKNESCES